MHTLCGEETIRRFEPVPIQIDVFHFDRLVVAIGSGDVTLPEYGKFVGDLVQQGLMHYRKIIDVTRATPRSSIRRCCSPSTPDCANTARPGAGRWRSWESATAARALTNSR